MKNYFRHAPLPLLLASAAGCTAPADAGLSGLEISKAVARAAVPGELPVKASATLKGDSVKFVYTVSNPGSGVARHVMLTDLLPDGVKTVGDGSGKVEMALGDLAAGARVVVEVPVRFSRCGKFASKGTATAGALSAESEAEVLSVAEPKLDLKFLASAPDASGAGVRRYGWRLTNSGDAEARNTVVIAALPEGVEVVETSVGATVGEASVRWAAGTLALGGTADVFVKVRGPSGSASSGARVFAYARCVGAVSDRATMPVAGE